MSCSKIFSGDLPELTYEVIKYFQNDYSTLYSCLLVNRLWCRLAIPLLWENPFSIRTRNYNFIEIYLRNLNDDDFNTKLNEYKIVNNSLPSNLLFNYTKFLKYLNIYKFILSVNKWLESFKGLIDICMTIFKIFIENEVNLHILEIENLNDYYHTCFDNILELILKNTKFIHNIRNINLFIDSASDYAYSSNSSKYKLIRNRISQIINLQQNLKKILISDNSFPLYRSLLLSKDFNCSNTLNMIIFYKVNFKFLNNNIFEQLNVLESIHIFYCSFDNNFNRQINNLTKPFKLKSLLIDEKSQIGSLELLLQKSGDYLEKFGFGPSLNQQLIELITKYCKNINFLYFSANESQVTCQIFNLIENIKQNLNYISIYVWYDYLGIGNRPSSMILQNLGQILPSKLEYLCLCLYCIKANDFEVFLKNSQDTFIKKLLIYNNKGQDILPPIKNYIMKKKRVKYLAISDSYCESTIFGSFSYNTKELISLKGEVNEFKLYNIEVQSYSDLSKYPENNPFLPKQNNTNYTCTIVKEGFYPSKNIICYTGIQFKISDNYSVTGRGEGDLRHTIKCEIEYESDGRPVFRIWFGKNFKQYVIESKESPTKAANEYLRRKNPNTHVNLSGIHVF
ncbi:hypothetical protein RhiirA1_474273 [Rhizophagus irregularis]|uniref:F-box domain-containing protein n=1 Tax=Rhizophagus irregularis TaxID=588596 RepID=A0A2N0QZ17_9GLOM|nr:hypothetical protein RhiirA1_474273 [Rhizophagus irregularis]